MKLTEKIIQVRNYFLISLHTIRLIFETRGVSPAGYLKECRFRALILSMRLFFFMYQQKQGSQLCLVFYVLLIPKAEFVALCKLASAAYDPLIPAFGHIFEHFKM